MCGIAGIVRTDGHPVDRDLLARMSEAIQHRGPDGEGCFLNGSTGLAMRRLAIIDLESGQQPIHNEDRTVWVVFNGEIYNHSDLRKELETLGHEFYTNSDTEVLIHAYEQYGTAFPRYLRGMFAFAIWDERKRELFCARDRVGKKPLLYALSAGQLIFASEFSALLRHPDISREIAAEAIHYYLSFAYVPAPLTAYRAIRKLEPAHTLRFTSDGRLEIKRYWQPDFSKKLKISEQEAAERTLEILREAVRVRLMSEVPIGAFLSGGVDSSAVVTLMSEQTSEPVKTFSIGFEEQDFSEIDHARRVAKHLGTDHHEFIVRPEALEVLPALIEHYGEPYADSSAIPTYYVSKETRRFVTVALNGDGGDECFAGYKRHLAMRLAEIYQRLPNLLREPLIARTVEQIPDGTSRRWRLIRYAKRFLRSASLPPVERYLSWVNIFDCNAKRELYTDEFKQEIMGCEPVNFLAPWYAPDDGLGVVDATLRADIMTYLPNDLLTKVDIASMAVSLEARSPFLDHHVIEFAASLPENFKLHGLTTKYLLKHALKTLVPVENLDRRKMGFCMPIGDWLRGHMQTFMRESLLAGRVCQRRLFKHRRVEYMIEEHTSGRHDYAQQLWTLLMLELWFKRFID